MMRSVPIGSRVLAVAFAVGACGGSSSNGGTSPDGGGADITVSDGAVGGPDGGGGAKDSALSEGEASPPDAGSSDASQSGGSDGGTAMRPVYNTGTGFFTLNSKIYDANGHPFLPTGLDAEHYDQTWVSCTSDCGTANSGANAMRVVVYDYTNTAQINKFITLLNSQHIVTIGGCFFTPSCANGTTGQGDGTPCLSECVTQWNSAYDTFKPFERTMMINIANEWGDGNATTWRDAYIAAVSSLRATGYLATLVIDAGGSGTNASSITNYAQAIYDADPQHNIIFSYHMYGATPASMVTTAESLVAAQTATAGAHGGWPALLGEFGPGDGADGATCTPLSIMQEADMLGIGWLAWAWDGNTPFNLTTGQGSGTFSLTNGAPTNGAFPNNTDLSSYGNAVILSPTYGLFNAQPAKATVF